MSRTYSGILRHDRIEWTGKAPEHIAPDQAVKVRVTILDDPAEASPRPGQGQKMREALEAVVRAGGLPGAPDGVKWQRKVRTDRRLPGRED